MAPNHINYLSAWLGISLTGAASTTINPIYTAEEVEFQLRQTEARAIVAHSMCLPVVKPVAEKLGIDVFCLDSDASESDGVLSWNALMDKPLGSIQPSDFVVDPDSIMTIPFSSGTTGVPKGVLLSHHNIVTNILQSMPDEGENMSPKPWRPEGSKVLVPLPFFHIYGMVAGMCVPLIAQAQMIFMQQFDLIRFLEIIQERLSREFNLDLIATAPSVVYKIGLRDGSEMDLHNPADLPDVMQIETIAEPWIKATILTPDEYLGGVIKLCQDRRGQQIELSYVGNRAMVVYELPLNEVVFDFYDRLKSISKGYASFDYEITEYKVGDLVKMSILVNA